MSDPRITALRKSRPRSRFLRFSLIAFFAILAASSWIGGELGFLRLVDERRLDNLTRFLDEIVPYPLRDGDPATTLGPWIRDVVLVQGAPAAWTTALLAVAAIALAGAGTLALAPLAARNVASPRPFGVRDRGANTRQRAHSLAWAAVYATARAGFLFARAIPEYVLAFLFLAILGPQAWPLVLALALHNFGILGRLGAELVENLPDRIPRQLRALGLDRRQVLLAAALPITLPRFLVFLFYRWETCLRDATVLGMLGFSSLGFLITEARARFRYDEMIAFVALSILLVLAGDLVSLLVRRSLRGTEPLTSTPHGVARPPREPARTPGD